METKRQVVTDQIIDLLHDVKVALAVIADQYELTPQQLWAVHMLHSKEMTMGHLASALSCDASNVTGITDRLVAQKIVVSRPSQQDRRVKLLALAPHGEEVFQACRQAIPEHLGITRLSLEELESIHEGLLKLSQNTKRVSYKLEK